MLRPRTHTEELVAAVRRPDRLLTRVRVTLVAAVIAYAAALLWRSGAPDVVAVALMLWVGLLAAAAGLHRVAAGPRGGVAMRAVDVVATNVALTIALLEGTLLAYGGITGDRLFIDRNIDAYRLQPHTNYGRLWTNSRGYPSREFTMDRREGEQRVALIGDSFAVGSVRQDMNFASVIERLRPDIEVYNFGISALGVDEYSHILRTEALSFTPDAVIVAFFIGNDVQSGLQRHSPALEIEDHALGVFVRRLWRVARERNRRGARYFLPQLAHAPAPEKGFTLSRETYLAVQTERLSIARRSRAAAHAAEWERSLAVLRDMADSVWRRGIAFGVVIIPDEFQANPRILDEILRASGTVRADVDLTRPQRTLLEFCRQQQIACLDLLPMFAGTTDTYLPQDTHWNEKGNRIAAAAIVSWLAASVLPDERLNR